MACIVALTFESVDKILQCDIHMQPLCQYFHTVLFFELEFLTFEKADELILQCDHSSETSPVALSHRAFFSVFCKIKSEIMSKFDLIHFRGVKWLSN